MGAPPDPEQMIQMLQNPEFAQTMNAALSNPQFLDMMIRSNPVLQNMGPGVRQMMQSEEFRRMLTDPETIRHMTQVGRQLGVGPWASGRGGTEPFPAPGITNQTPTNAVPSMPLYDSPSEPPTTARPPATTRPPTTTQPPTTQPPTSTQPNITGAANPFALLYGTPPTGDPPTDDPAAAANPYRQLAADLESIARHQQQQQANSINTNPGDPPQDPRALQHLLALLGGGAGGSGGAAAGLNLPGAVPADTRPPEE
ncbi:hypothetical protein GP486_008415, partial [Trichoglossum hirsutum]